MERKKEISSIHLIPLMDEGRLLLLYADKDTTRKWMMGREDEAKFTALCLDCAESDFDRLSIILEDGVPRKVDIC